MFPKAQFVQMVRNPYVVFPSTMRLWKSLYASHGYQKPKYDGLEEYVLRTFIKMHRRLEATRELIDPGRFHSLRYEDLLRHPVGETCALYERLGLSGFESIRPAVEAYFRQRADYRPNRYELPPKLHAEITRRWRPYFQQHGYPTTEEVGGQHPPRADGPCLP